MTTPTRQQSRWFVLPCHRSHARRNDAGRYGPSVMTGADQAMHLIVEEVEELERVANTIAAEPLNPKDRILKCHGNRRTVSALGRAFAAASELGALDRRQATVPLPLEQSPQRSRRWRREMAMPG
jgi:hypothetical protein